MVRVAFTLIELIFAIVIIGISVLSLPMMTQATADGIDKSLVQEAIFAGATELNQAVTAHWDESSFDVNTSDGFSKVVHTRDCNTTTKLRPGHINQELHRRCTDTNSTVSNAVADLTVTSLNDMTHVYQDIFQNATSSAAGYKDVYKSQLSIINPATFGTLANSNDIKRLIVTINNSDGELITELHTYSANIGEIDYYKRRF